MKSSIAVCVSCNDEKEMGTVLLQPRTNSTIGIEITKNQQ